MSGSADIATYTRFLPSIRSRTTTAKYPWQRLHRYIYIDNIVGYLSTSPSPSVDGSQ
ncbi:uncharacterized protein HHUB_1535 [Halobacterium hubeiense]|uniref:Uncharacterized protein n=1 Tax=Halobacterium hubeiense TaxID=1407499 RepID=A0A0U5H2S2_9EURY|nr:uncharacterized protein HHUB_1535 [Halobacterium hubeiense]